MKIDLTEAECGLILSALAARHALDLGKERFTHARDIEQLHAKIHTAYHGADCGCGWGGHFARSRDAVLPVDKRPNWLPKK